MANTFKDGDFVVSINRFLFPLKIRYNDVCIIKRKKSSKEVLIKRCIGLPGDTIDFKDAIFINNRMIPLGNTMRLNCPLTKDQFNCLIRNIVIDSSRLFAIETKSRLFWINLTVEEIGLANIFLKIDNIKNIQYMIDFNHQSNRLLLKKSDNLNNHFLLKILNNISGASNIDNKQSSYFFIGDNLGSSYDSRFFGPISENLILAVVLFKINSSAIHQ